MSFVVYEKQIDKLKNPANLEILCIQNVLFQILAECKNCLEFWLNRNSNEVDFYYTKTACVYCTKKNGYGTLNHYFFEFIRNLEDRIKKIGIPWFLQGKYLKNKKKRTINFRCFYVYHF